MAGRSWGSGCSCLFHNRTPRPIGLLSCCSHCFPDGTAMYQGQSKSQSLLGREEALPEEVTWPLWPWSSPLSSRSLQQVLRLARTWLLLVALHPQHLLRAGQGAAWRSQKVFGNWPVQTFVLLRRGNGPRDNSDFPGCTVTCDTQSRDGPGW